MRFENFVILSFCPQNALSIIKLAKYVYHSHDVKNAGKNLANLAKTVLK